MTYYAGNRYITRRYDLGTALGAAIDAAVALKLHNDFPEAVGSMVRVKQTFTPHEENVRIYDRLFNEVYKKLYPAISPLNARIAEITGYPKIT